MSKCVFGLSFCCLRQWEGGGMLEGFGGEEESFIATQKVDDMSVSPLSL